MNTLRGLYQRCLHNGSLFAVLSALGFSLKAIFVKLSYAASQVDAITLLAMRMGLSLPLFAWLVVGQPRPGQCATEPGGRGSGDVAGVVRLLPGEPV